MSGESEPEVKLSEQQISVVKGSDGDAESLPALDWTHDEEVKAKRKYVDQRPIAPVFNPKWGPEGL